MRYIGPQKRLRNLDFIFVISSYYSIFTLPTAMKPEGKTKVMQILTSEQFLNGLIGAGFGDANPWLQMENDLGVRITTLLEDAGWIKSEKVKYSDGLQQQQTFIIYSHPDMNLTLTYRDEIEYAARGHNALPPIAINFI